MGGDRTTRMLSLYGVYAGVALISWWVAYGIQALPAALTPLDVRGGHIAAEVALGVALIVGGVLTGRRSVIGRPVLIAALGGLTYAVLNIIGDYFVLLPARTPMFMLLLVASASAVATLVMAVRRES
jgi:predicted secreted protein